MPQQLTMPNVGEGVAEGTVTRWLKHEGDRVALDEPVVEIETDKAVVDIPSPYEGVLGKILVQEGEVVPIGTPLAEMETEAGPATPAASATSAAPERATQSQVSSQRRASDTPVEMPPARPRDVAGVLLAGNEERQPVGTGTAVRGSGAATQAAARSAERQPARTRRYSPVVLKLAAENGVDLDLVRGTGIEGRVTRQDVLRYIENPAANTVPAPATAGVVGVDRGTETRAAIPGAPTPPSSPAAPSDGAGDTVMPLSPTRRTIASRMLQSHQTIPVAWMVVEADVTALVALREQTKDEFRHVEGVNLTYMPFFVQAIVAALRQHPRLNSTYAEDGLTQHARHDIGIAVATESGLVVPVVRNAGDLSIPGLAHEIERLAAKARDRKLSIDDMRGATFTIDNTGAFGSVISQPLVPVGQAAIITTEAIRQELRPVAGATFGLRSVMNVCVSFDHRVLDGTDVGRFMLAVKERLEAPDRDW